VVRRSKSLKVLVFGALVCAPWAASATTLDYDAYVGSTKVGGAEVVIQRGAESSYLIQGRLWAEGVFRFLTEWNSRFTAQGHVEDGMPVVQTLNVIQQAKNKMKEVTMADGAVTYLKNGVTKMLAPPQSRLDVISALFMPMNGCDAGSEIHNGKEDFALQLLGSSALPASSGANLRCEFQVRDEDDQTIDAVVFLGVVDGLTVPVRLDLTGAMQGTLKLRA
jgi:hypothetical protein